MKFKNITTNKVNAISINKSIILSVKWMDDYSFVFYSFTFESLKNSYHSPDYYLVQIKR